MKYFTKVWGLPIAESIANGVPCICSNTSSMTEVAPGFVEYFNPTSADECLDAIKHYMGNSNYEKAKRNIKKYKPVSWDDTYKQIEQALSGLDDKIVVKK